MTDPVTPSPPPAVADSLAAIQKAISALQNKSSPSGEVTTDPGVAPPGAAGSAADTATVDAAPTPGAVEEDAAVRIARNILAKRIDIALDAALAPQMERAGRLMLSEAGASVGLNDAGEPTLQTKGGEDLPITSENVEKLIGGQFAASRGKPGTGLRPGGTAPRSVDVIGEGLRSQEFFDKNRRAYLEEYARRVRGGQ